MGEIPEWLRPYCKQGAYIPTKEDIESLEPQSRREMLLKYAALNSGGEEEDKYAAFKALVDKSITEVTADMLQGATSIGKSAFAYCSNLTSIEMPNSVTSIEYEAFGRCSNLTSIEMPNSVTSIASYAFQFCSNLASIEISSSVTRISNSIFYYCTSLASIEIPSSVTHIDNLAFSYCTSLASIEIPSSVIYIGSQIFSHCTSLTSVTVKATTPPYLDVNKFGTVSPNLVIYVPAESVDAYKSASIWSTYADKIQAIPSE